MNEKASSPNIEHIRQIAKEHDARLTADFVNEVINRYLYSSEFGGAVAASRRTGKPTPVPLLDAKKFKVVIDQLEAMCKEHRTLDPSYTETGEQCLTRIITAANDAIKKELLFVRTDIKGNVQYEITQNSIFGRRLMITYYPASA